MYALSMESLTSNLKEYLTTDDPAIGIAEKGDTAAPLTSVYGVATTANMTLREYVASDPATALLIAESNVAEWNEIMTQAILTGYVTSPLGGRSRANKNTVDMLKIKMQQANDELRDVKKIAESAGPSNNKATTLIQTLYKRAVETGDTRALLYLIDRVDGKIGDIATQEDRDHAANIYLILHSLFDRQLEVLNSGPGTKMIACSRRSGKTHLAVAAALVSTLAKPNTTCLYIGKTAREAEQLFATGANQMIDKVKLKDKKGNRLNWRHLDNGSRIMVRGLSNTKDPDKIRGFKAEIIIIDEFFHMNNDLLQYMLDEVLGPMQMDYALTYKMILIGTPPRDYDTVGERMWNEAKVDKFKWTWRENPYIINGQEYLDKLFKSKGIDPHSPFALREYGGEWIKDSDFLLFPTYYTYDPNVSLPPVDVSVVTIGVDYGSADSNAIIGVAWDAEQTRGYVFYESKFNILSTGGQGAIQYMKQRAKECWKLAMGMFPTLEPRDANKRISWYADSNGSSQMLSQELNRGVRFSQWPDLSIQIVDAHRLDSKMMFDKIRDLFRTAALLIPANGELSIECQLTALRKDDSGNVMNEIDDKKFHPDAIHALRYAMWPLIGRTDIGGSGFDIGAEGISQGTSIDVSFEISEEPVYKRPANYDQHLKGLNTPTAENGGTAKEWH